MAWNDLVGKITFEDDTSSRKDFKEGLLQGVKTTRATLLVESASDWATDTVSDEEFTQMHEMLAENIHRTLYQTIIEQVMEMSNNFEFLYSKSDMMDNDQQTAWMSVLDSILNIKRDMGMQT